MRHHDKQRSFVRVKKVRTGLMRSLARALVLHGSIVTTVAKAKEIRPYVEKLVTVSNTIESKLFFIIVGVYYLVK